MTTGEASNDPPLVWVLQTARAGDSAQARALAEALGWPFKLKILHFNGFYNVPNALLGATLASLGSGARWELEPPWPDLVIAVARRTVPIARWIRKQSGGNTRLVHLGRPRLSARHFDLVISSPQYGVPDAPNVLQLPVPLHPSPNTENLQAWEATFTQLPRPWTVIVLGGETWPFRLDTDAVQTLARQVNVLTGGAGTALISPSPRTPDGVAQALGDLLQPEVCIPESHAGGENPYPALLQLADRFVVTGDSASMLGEACAQTKPVYIFDLPRRAMSQPVSVVGSALANLALLYPPRDMHQVHRILFERGHAADLARSEAHGYTHTPLIDVLPAAAARVKALFTPPAR